MKRVALLLLLLPALAHAQTDTPPLAPSTAQQQKSELCTPTEGVAALEMSEAFPERGTAGHFALLTVRVAHGKGETLLPRGVQQEGDSAATKALRTRGFRIPESTGATDAGGAAVVAREEQNDRAVSTLKLPLVLLPDEAGTVHATLPPLPLSLVQASGNVVTVCTNAHEITIVDPTANVPTPKPKDNPPLLRQREHWQALENALWGIGAAIVCTIFGALAYRSWSRRPKPTPPPPPPRPPWEIALEQLDAIAKRKDEPAHTIDRVTDVLREYLGNTYAFDGLESTTEEVLEALESRGAMVQVRTDVARVLRESDLVKFASAEAEPEAAADTLQKARQLVLRTMPEREPTNANEVRQ